MLIIRIGVHCIAYDKHSYAMHWYEIPYDKHRCAIYWNLSANDKHSCALHCF